MAKSAHGYLSQRIKSLRSKKGITQKQLAERIEVSYGSIVDYENGRREPNCRAMAALETFFGVSGAYLCGIIDDAEEARKQKSASPTQTNADAGDALKKFSRKEKELLTELLDCRGIGEDSNVTNVQKEAIRAIALVFNLAFPQVESGTNEADRDNLSFGA